MKPLNGKAYGSIPHLPGSRLGEGDHHCHAGQAEICLNKPRRGDLIIVQEKLDGCCCSVANVDGSLLALSRSGYLARSSPYEHLQLFDVWVRYNLHKFEFLRPGERVVGEWMAMAHGTLYDHYDDNFSPFIAFDIIRNGQRVIHKEMLDRVWSILDMPCVIYHGEDGCSISKALDILGDNGYHGAIEKVEGAVWRVERKGKVDFLAKYVRHDKVDGKYLPNISGQEPIWYWRPDR